MDKFNKNALIACAAMSTLIIVFFYAGTALGHNGLSGSDDKVTEEAATVGNKTPHSSLYELDQNGEYVGFTALSIGGGFMVGYIWVMTFDEEVTKGAGARG
jgi:hypothetical protein